MNARPTRAGWLALAPRDLPTFRQLVEDLADPGVTVIAQFLGVAESTVKRWGARDNAPRVARAALYYQTSYGRSAIDVGMFNDCRMLAMAVDNLQIENKRLQKLLEHVGGIGEFGSANDPVQEIQTNGDMLGGHGRRYIAGGRTVKRVEEKKSEITARVAKAA